MTTDPRPDPTCVFCKIVGNQIPAIRLGENAHAIAFRDLNPQAPVHVLVIPKTHHASLAAVPAGQEAALGSLLGLAREVAASLGVVERGYRLVINTGAEGGQVVPHLHLHLLAGRQLGWPPG